MNFIKSHVTALLILLLVLLISFIIVNHKNNSQNFLGVNYFDSSTISPLVTNSGLDSTQLVNSFTLSTSGLLTSQNFNDLESKLKLLEGTFSVVIFSKELKLDYALNPQHLYYAASLYKIPVSIAALNYISTNNITGFKKDYIKELVFLALNQSDNNAQTILINTVGEKSVEKAVNDLLGETGTTFYLSNTATPKQIITVFKTFYESDYVKKADKDFILSALRNTLFEDRIAENLNQGTTFYHKIGNWPDTGTWHDCGIILTSDKKIIYLCLMSENTTLEEFKNASKLTADFINSL